MLPPNIRSNLMKLMMILEENRNSILIKCIVCAACTIACPANALTMRTDPVTGDRTWSLFLGRCIFCGRCEEVCPTKAIRLTQDFELSVTNKQDLFQETTFSTVSCQECGKPFISYKELNYTIDLFKQSLGDPESSNKN